MSNGLPQRLRHLLSAALLLCAPAWTTLTADSVQTRPLAQAAGAGILPPAAHPALGTLADDPTPPASTIKLVFIHHSTGEGWLADDHGRLGMALRDNNYFVSDTNYDWGPDSIGSLTDIGHWWLWFLGPKRDAYMAALLNQSGQRSSYSRLSDDPGGENRIVMFKSCFPNSQMEGHPDDPPTAGPNPLQGNSEPLTVGNAKRIYNDLLAYFATRQDKLFVVITAPPLAQGSTDSQAAANARAFNNWLVHTWLASYPQRNVAVFDFYNVLTSNGGSPGVNDLGAAGGNHHRWRNGAVEHIQTTPGNYSTYPSSPDDSHPTAAGGQKASAEFLPLLNVFYRRWVGSPAPASPTPSATRTPTTRASPTRTSTPALATRTSTPTRTRIAPPSATPGRFLAYLPPILKGFRFQVPIPTATRPVPSTTPIHGLTPTQAQGTVVIQRGLRGDIADAYIWQSSPDYTGDWETLYTGCVGPGRKKTLLRFDLSSLDAGAALQSATLCLQQKTDGGARSVHAHRVLRDWDETTVTWAGFAAAYDQTVIGAFSAAGEGLKQVDITGLVAQWLDGRVPNQGVLLDDPGALTDENEEYWAGECEEQSLRPKLVIVLGGR